ncbi:hypothetical protein WJX73_003706 [Symbiochloris irregularis]|uniref:Uncharacterized protein n=1 Tax=Symbiochloris irregularis TaxID=706552 RepID=A0AAW1NTD8_9CHLO
MLTRILQQSQSVLRGPCRQIAPASLTSWRELQTSNPSLAQNHCDDPNRVKDEKEKYMSGKSTSTVKGMKGWHEPLASESEAAIKAEKHSSEETIEEMQAHTVKKVKVLHHGEEDDEEHHPPKNIPERAKK